MNNIFHKPYIKLWIKLSFILPYNIYLNCLQTTGDDVNHRYDTDSYVCMCYSRGNPYIDRSAL
jgi:hypothetical protein